MTGRVYPNRVWDLRMAFGIEQRTLARVAGVSPDALVQLEHGTRVPRAATVAKIAAVFAVDPYQLQVIDGDGGTLPVIKTVRANGGPHLHVDQHDRRAHTTAVLPAHERQLLDSLTPPDGTDTSLDAGVRAIAEHLHTREGQATVGRIRHLATVWISATAANVPDALARLDTSLHRLTNRGAA